MTATASPSATYQDLLALPGDRLGQIVNGELVSILRPPVRHTQLSALVSNELLGPFDRGQGGPGGWWILDEPEIRLDQDVLVPDLAGWKRSRLTGFPRSFPVESAPDWVGEVLWPGSASLDRIRKMPLYARAGVQHVWLLDPVERALEIYRLEEGRFSMVSGFTGDAPVHAEPFGDIELVLGGLWRAVR